MSLAYLDPGNLESNLQQGSYTRYDLVWVLWWATVVGLVLQEMSARIGLVTGRDLAQTVRRTRPPPQNPSRTDDQRTACPCPRNSCRCATSIPCGSRASCMS